MRRLPADTIEVFAALAVLACDDYTRRICRCALFGIDQVELQLTRDGARFVIDRMLGRAPRAWPNCAVRP